MGPGHGGGKNEPLNAFLDSGSAVGCRNGAPARADKPDRDIRHLLQISGNSLDVLSVIMAHSEQAFILFGNLEHPLLPVMIRRRINDRDHKTKSGEILPCPDDKNIRTYLPSYPRFAEKTG